MSEPAHRFTIEADADYGAFVDSPHLRWTLDDGSGWYNTRPGDLLLECVAQELAEVARRADSLAKIAAAAEALIRAACEKPYPPSDLLWGDLAAALWGSDDPRTREYREAP